MSALKRLKGTLTGCLTYRFAYVNVRVADLRALVALAEKASKPSLMNDLWANDVRELRELHSAVLRTIAIGESMEASNARVIVAMLDSLREARDDAALAPRAKGRKRR